MPTSRPMRFARTTVGLGMRSPWAMRKSSRSRVRRRSSHSPSGTRTRSTRSSSNQTPRACIRSTIGRAAESTPRVLRERETQRSCHREADRTRGATSLAFVDSDDADALFERKLDDRRLTGA